MKVLKNAAYIDGKWVETKRTFSVFSPHDGKEITRVADLGKEEATRAVEAAERAFCFWSGLLAHERAKFLFNWAEAIQSHADELAKLLTLEQGKMLDEAMEEITDGVDVVRWYAEEAKRIHGNTQSAPDKNRTVMTIREPIGVIAAISPWNFPFYIPLQKCAAAMAAGCTTILKPAEDTPLCAIALAYLCEQVGIPQGVFNVVTCKDPKDVGEMLMTHPFVKKVTFTGSTEVGKKILQMSASTVKRATLELGGNCPLIIFEDAQIEKALNDALGLKFYNCGQCCNTINRIFVHKSIYDAFIEKFAQKARDLNLAPLINEQGKNKIERLIEEACLKGAKIVCGGKGKGGLFFESTVLKDVKKHMDIYKEEIFGPVAPFYPFESEEEVLEMANDTNYGLAAYFYTENIERALRVSEKLQAGSIGINTTSIFSITLPFGGFKESGIGREGGLLDALNAFCEVKSLCFGKK